MTRQQPQEHAREQDDKGKRQVDVRAAAHDEVLIVGDCRIPDERQERRVDRHPVPLAEDNRRLLAVPVLVDVLCVPEVPALIAAGLGHVDALGVGVGGDDVEDAEGDARSGHCYPREETHGP